METENHEQSVKERYAAEAKNEKSNLFTGMCSTTARDLNKQAALAVGYTEEQIDAAPQDANLGLGCGNPLAFSHIKKGDTVLDLGSGGGFDCFLASTVVGENGKVIGVDFTPEMVEKAKANAEKGNYRNVKFILGNIDSIPLPDDTVDLIISNCVINLTANKQQVFDESYRVLHKGGHMSVSDIVLTKYLPPHFLDVMRMHKEFLCFTGAEKKDIFLRMLMRSGFKNIQIIKEYNFAPEMLMDSPLIQTIIAEIKPSQTEIQNILKTILSVSFYAEK